MQKWGASDYNEAVVAAAGNGHIEIAKLCKEWGANDFDEAMCCAAELDISKLSNYAKSGERGISMKP